MASGIRFWYCRSEAALVRRRETKNTRSLTLDEINSKRALRMKGGRTLSFIEVACAGSGEQNASTNRLIMVAMFCWLPITARREGHSRKTVKLSILLLTTAVDDSVAREELASKYEATVFGKRM